MHKIAFVTSKLSIDIDFDMPLLVKACQVLDLNVSICDWEDPDIDWSKFDAIILRSPWNYVDKPKEFLHWYSYVSDLTKVMNSYSICKWNLDKNYLTDLSNRNINTVPFLIIKEKTDYKKTVDDFITKHLYIDSIVIKPSIGAYSKGVKRLSLTDRNLIYDYIEEIHSKSLDAILQPYIKSIDTYGEANLTFFNNQYSHAIKKAPLLKENGDVNVPTQDVRSFYQANIDERKIAIEALNMVATIFNDGQPLLYGRVDLVRDELNKPIILELELFEPSLNLPFSNEAGKLFAEAIVSKIREEHT